MFPRIWNNFFIDFRSFCGDNFQFDFLAFAETRLDTSIEQSYRMSQYNLICNSRNTSGGGVCLCINFKMCNELLCLTPEIESLFVYYLSAKIQYFNDKVVVCNNPKQKGV